jgi:malonyl-CoA O-methyltransferase
MPDAALRRTIDERAVRHALGRLARAHEAPWLHREVARRLGERLAIVKRRPARVLDASGRLGAGATVLDELHPQAKRWSVEAGGPVQARTPWWRRWLGQGPDIVRLGAGMAWPEAVGLVWSNMALHASADPPAEFARWLAALEVDGFVMFSCLGPGTLVELREIYARRGWGPPMADGVDMHDLGDMLVHAGFADPVMDQETVTLTWPSARAALDELRTIGANAAPGRFAGWRTPRWRAALETELASRGTPVRLSFEFVYGHAFKAAPRERVPPETRVSLDEMRSLVRAGAERTLR